MKNNLIVEKIGNMSLTLQGDAFKPVKYQKGFHAHATRLLDYVKLHRENPSLNAQMYNELKNRYDLLIEWYGIYAKTKGVKNNRLNIAPAIAFDIASDVPGVGSNGPEASRESEGLNGH